MAEPNDRMQFVPGPVRAALELVERVAADLAARSGRPDRDDRQRPMIAAQQLEAWSAAAACILSWADTVDAQLRIVHAAQAQWRFFARVLDAVAFQNAAGELAHVPFALVRLLADGATLPFVVEVVGTDVVYRRGRTLFCRVPCTLHVVLKDLIAGRPWETPGK